MNLLPRISAAVVLMMISLGVCAQAATAQDAFQKKVFTHEGEQLNYRILYPVNFDSLITYPLVIFMHGMGERGEDNTSQLRHGSQLFLDSIEQYPAVVLFPQCPPTDYWARVQRNARDRVSGFNTGLPPGRSMKLAMALIRQFLAEPYIDTNRVYLTGLSMGGMAVWELLWRMPHQMAAAMPICGGGPPTKAAMMTDVSIWSFHGTHDDIVNPGLNVRMVMAVQENGGTAKITLFPGVNHNAWDPAFAEPDFLSWMFSKQRYHDE